MKPVAQTTFRPNGNCFAACIASLFECRIMDVPPFHNPPAWLQDLDRWLAPRGFTYLELDWTDPRPFMSWHGSALCIGSGPSARGFPHAVIGRFSVTESGHQHFENVHDPHPDRTYLVRLSSIGLFLPKWEGKRRWGLRLI